MADEAAAKVWAAGNYVPIGERLQPAAARLVARAGVTAGQEVLDVGVGSGSVAVAAARAGATVTGVDIVDAWWGEARRRASAAGVELDLHLGDVTDLPFDDGRFDVTLSSFAAIFADDQARTAAELARVTRPDGTVAMTAWMSDGPGERLTEVLAAHLPPGDDPNAAMRWGDPDHARSLFRAVGVEVAVEDAHLTWVFSSAEDFLTWLFTNSGGWATTRERLVGDGTWSAILPELIDVARSLNETHGAGFTLRLPYRVLIGTRG